MKKRGLSEVVTVTLVVLLAIAAVIIVWTFVRGTLEDAGKQITSDCTTIDVDPVSCTGGGGTVSIKNGAGDVTIDAVKLIFYDSSGNSVTADGGCSDVTPLATVDCSPSVAPSDASGGVEVAGVVGGVQCPATSRKIDCS